MMVKSVSNLVYILGMVLSINGLCAAFILSEYDYAKAGVVWFCAFHFLYKLSSESKEVKRGRGSKKRSKDY